jgi:prepilin peptidase CpaA
MNSAFFAPDVAPLTIVCPLLVAVALNDLKHLRIPNTLVFASLAVFALCTPINGLPEATIRFAFCGIAFAICAGLFAFRIMGGGDTKMIPIMFLFIPSDQAAFYMVVFAWSLLAGIILMRLLRLGLQYENAAWVAMRPHADFPMGTAIALSGFAFLAFTVA